MGRGPSSQMWHLPRQCEFGSWYQKRSGKKKIRKHPPIKTMKIKNNGLPVKTTNYSNLAPVLN